jgi:phytoene desaturase
LKRLIVIGSGVGGLSAAIHGRLAGYETLVVGKEKPGGKAAGIEVDGYKFDPGPSIIILPELYRSLFRKAGRNPDDYLQFHRLDPISQVRLEGELAMNLPASRQAAEELVFEISHSDGVAFRDLLATLDEVAPLVESSIFHRPIEKPWHLANPRLIQMALRFDVSATYRQLVDRWFSSPMLRAFFYGFPSYGGQTYHSKAPGALLIPYLMLEGGVYYPKGGVAAIPKALVRLAKELGVEFQTGEVSAVETSGKFAKAVTVNSAGEIRKEKADAFICNVDRYTAGKWFGRETVAPPSLSYFTVHMGLPRKLERTEHHMLLIPRDFEEGFESLYGEGHYPARPIVYLNDTTCTDPTTAPEGHTNLFAVVTSPADNGKVDWASQTPQLVSELKDQLALFGVLNSNEPLVFERVQTPLTFAKRDANYRGSLYGVEEAHRLFGMLPEGPRDPHLKNWMYAGGSAQPGAGLPMVMLSGGFAVSALDSQS